MNLFRYVALRHLRLKPARVALAVLGICCGTALYVALSMINQATSVYFHQSIEAVTGSATLLVSAGPAGLPESLALSVEKVAGVTAVAPIIESRSWLPASEESIIVLGVDLLQDHAVRHYNASGKSPIADPLTFISHTDSVIVTQRFADAHHLRSGDSMSVSTANGTARLTIRGLLTDADIARAYGGNIAVMDIDAARVAFGKRGKTDRLDVVTAKDANLDNVAAGIRAAVGPGYTVMRPELMSASLDRTVQSFQFLTHLLTMLALIVGVLMISSCVAISVAERRKEIGTLRAMGTPRGAIIRLFVVESLIMGTMGSLLGALAGRALALIMVKGVTAALAESSAHHIESGPLRMTPGMFLTAIAIGAAASVLASLVPAYRAARISPVEAMKDIDNGASAKTPRHERRRAWAGLLLLALFSTCSSLITGASPMVLQATIQVFAIFGVALFGPALVLGALHVLKTAGAESAGIVPRLASENMLKNPARTRSQATVLLIGLTLVVVIACVSQSFKQSLLSHYDKTLHADLIVSATGRFHDAETQLLSPKLGTQIAALDGVLGVCAVRESPFEYLGNTITLKSYDEPPAYNDEADSIFDVRDRSPLQASFELFHAHDPVLFASEVFATRLHKHTGELIELHTPDGPVSFRIVGVIADFADPQGTLIMSRANYLKHFHSDLVGGYAVRVKPGYAPLVVRQALDHALAKQYSLTILSNAEIKNQVAGVIDSSFEYTKAAQFMALIVALLGLMDTILISVFERTRELGLMRAIGRNRGSVAGMILLEAAEQGLLAGIVAIGLGTFIAVIWTREILSHSIGWVITFHFPWPVMATTLALGVAVTIIAAWYPAKRAAEIEIVEALTCL